MPTIRLFYCDICGHKLRFGSERCPVCGKAAPLANQKWLYTVSALAVVSFVFYLN
jgi:hypothetical protein